MKKLKPAGIVGLGRMGGPLAQRMMQMKYPLLLWDVMPQCRKPFADKAGVKLVPPGEMAEACAVIFFVVPSSKEIAACMEGKDGVLASAKKGLVICDLTTSDPVATKKMARRAARRGIEYLDAGMSGGPAGILAGTLALMVGGDKKVLASIKPYLDGFASNVFHLGDLGSGHAMKLIHNMVLHTIFLATCEGARMTERMGMKVRDMVDIFNVSTAYSYASRHRFPNNILNGSWNAQARVYNPYKDVGIAMRLARECKAHVPLGERTFAFIEKAVKIGMAEQDYSLLYRDFEKIRKSKGG